MRLSLKDTPIQRKLMLVIFATSLAAVLLTLTTLFAYQFVVLRQTTLRQLSTLGGVVAKNSTAPLAFQHAGDAGEILSALQSERHIEAAALYDQDGKLFVTYPTDATAKAFPAVPGVDGYRIETAYLVGFEPVVKDAKRLGTLYLKFETGTIISAWLWLSFGIATVVIGVVLAVTFVLSRVLHREVSLPILALADTARSVSERRDYSLRAIKHSEDEVGLLTDAFNDMLTQVQEQNRVRGRLAAIVESSDDAIISRSLEGIITTWNPGAEKIFGYTAQEIIGQPVFLLVPPELHEEESAILARLAGGGGVQLSETVRIRKDGTHVQISATMSPLKDADGRVLGDSQIARDITERKIAEQKIRSLNAELEQRVVERTRSLEAANRELESFSYSVSHDLRAPLRHIDGYAQMLSEHVGDALGEKPRRYLRTIVDTVEEMGLLIDNLLEFSRMGRAELQRGTVALDALMDETLAGLGDGMKGRNIVWKRHPLPTVQGDAALLKQVLVNLASNALKYSRARDPAIIEIGSNAGTNGEIVVYVRDNGAGFDMKYATKLFGVFQRLHRADEFEGTGIGLANVRRIIQRHGGRVWADASPGVGATFYFTLPLAAANSPL